MSKGKRQDERRDERPEQLTIPGLETPRRKGKRRETLVATYPAHKGRGTTPARDGE